MDITKIKQQAIAETLEKFKRFENLNSTKGFDMAGEKELNDFLESKLLDYSDTINYYERKYKISPKKAGEKLIKGLEKLEIVKQSFNDASIINDINQYIDDISNKMKDYCYYAFLYGGINTYFKEITEDKSVLNEPSILKFSDLLEDKYKQKELEIFALLGKCFPEYYNENGIALNNKNNIKAILNSWYKLLRAESIICFHPTKVQSQKDICKLISDECGFKSITPKTLFHNDGIENNPSWNLFHLKLKNEIKALKNK